MLFTIYFQFETQLINTRIKDLLCRCDFIDLTDMWNYFAILQHKNRFILSFFFWKRIALKAHISLENIVLSFMTKVSHKNVLKKQRKTNVTLRMSSCSTSSVWFKFLKVFVLECLINKHIVWKLWSCKFNYNLTNLWSLVDINQALIINQKWQF